MAKPIGTTYIYRVKAVSAILSLMVLLMVTLPCADAPLSHETGTEQVADLEHQETAHLDFCTPFCTCHCCQTHITQLGLLDLQEIITYKAVPPTKSHGLFDRMSFSIWDPPRILS